MADNYKLWALGNPVKSSSIRKYCKTDCLINLLFKWTKTIKKNRIRTKEKLLLEKENKTRRLFPTLGLLFRERLQDEPGDPYGS